MYIPLSTLALLTDILVGFSNGSVKVCFRVIVKVDEREDKEIVAIANKVGKTLRDKVKTGQIGSLNVKPTVELRGLYCGIDVFFLRSLIESFVDPLIDSLIHSFIDSFIDSLIHSLIDSLIH